MKTKIFIISHGDFAEGLHKTVEMITGPQKNIFSFGLKGDLTTKKIAENIKEEIKYNDFAIILGDLAGGSVCNEAVSLLNNQNCILVGGINLPLLIDLILSEADTKDKVREAIKMTRLELKEIEICEKIENDSMEDFLK